MLVSLEAVSFRGINPRCARDAKLARLCNASSIIHGFARKAHHYPKYGAIAFILVMMASKEGNARRHLGSVRSGVRLKTHTRAHINSSRMY